MRERKPKHDDAHRPIKVRAGFVRTDAVIVSTPYTPQCGTCGHWHAVNVICRPSNPASTNAEAR